jgi:Rrf2 family protein
MFALSQTTSYGVAALACLARDERAWHQMAVISQCLGVASPYLAKVLHRLSKEGLVETKRGYQGGYRIGRSAASIRLLDVVRAIEGGDSTERCMLGMAQCSDDRACPLHEFWKPRRKAIASRLASIHVADLARFSGFQQVCCRTPGSHDAPLVRARGKTNTGTRKVKR